MALSIAIPIRVYLLEWTNIQVQAPVGALVHNSHRYLSICSRVRHLQCNTINQITYRFTYICHKASKEMKKYTYPQALATSFLASRARGSTESCPRIFAAPCEGFVSIPSGAKGTHCA